MKEAHFTLPSLPPSINSLYELLPSRGPGGRIYIETRLNPKARAWKTEAKEVIDKGAFKLPPDATCEILITFYYPLKYKNGNERRKDSQNLIKLVCDVVAEKCGFDDARIRAGSWATVDDRDERVEVIVREREIARN